uniref:Uncharacterized protein n=1 Tax=Oryza barthii TaxID=65489 RepID=A0A0D3HCH0_9ORYZ
MLVGNSTVAMGHANLAARLHRQRQLFPQRIAWMMLAGYSSAQNRHANLAAGLTLCEQGEENAGLLVQ